MTRLIKISDGENGNNGPLSVPTEGLVESGCLAADGDAGILVRIHAQPRASKNSVVGVHDGALKLRITAPPVDGKANALIAEVLAKLLRVPKTAVTLVSGPQSKHKRFRVVGVGLQTALDLLTAVGL